MTLTEQMDLVRKRELAQRLDQGEAEVLKKVAADLPAPPQLDDQTRADLGPFIDWTTRKNCRYAPAKPFVVAAYLLDIATTGVSTGALLRRVTAISILHDRHGLSDPTNTTAVREVLNDLVAIEPPRSWTKEEKAEFATFPIPAQRVISRREQDRERALRQKQNQLAEKLKTVSQTAPEISKPVNSEKKEVVNNGCEKR
jgi:hypothetical protein